MENKDFEERIKHLQTKVQADREKRGPANKKRLPRFFIFFNIFILFVMIIHYFRTNPETTHYGISLRQGGIHYQLTIEGDNKKKYIASLSVTNRSEKHLSARYRRPLAKVLLSNRGTACQELIMGEEVAALDFKPGESHAFVKKINDARIIAYMLDRPGSFVAARDNILEKRNKYIPLTVELEILTPEPVATSTEIKYLLD